MFGSKRDLMHVQKERVVAESRAAVADAMSFLRQLAALPIGPVHTQVYIIILGLTLFFSCHTTHTTTAERRAEKQCRRRGASSGYREARSHGNKETQSVHTPPEKLNYTSAVL